MQKICQVCGRPFEGHPSAKNCSLRCTQRGKHLRRKEREAGYYPLEKPLSPYAFIYDNVTAEILTQIYNDVLLHAYDRDIRINGPLPPNVPRPPDVYLIDAGDHHLVYHRSRELVLP